MVPHRPIFTHPPDAPIHRMPTSRDISVPQNCNGKACFTNNQVCLDHWHITPIWVLTMLKVQEAALLGREPINGGVWGGPLDSLAYGYREEHAKFSPTPTLRSSNLAFYYDRRLPTQAVDVGTPFINRGSRRPFNSPIFSLQAAPHLIPRTDPPPVNDTVRGPSFNTAPTADHSHVSWDPGSVQGYLVPEFSRDVRSVRASTVSLSFGANIGHQCRDHPH